eukprot:213928_1
MNLLLVLFVSIVQSNSWHYVNQQLPKPLDKLLMGYNNVTSYVYIFGGRTNMQSCETNGCENKIYKWNINNMSSEWIQLDTNTTTDCFWGYISNSITIDNLVYFVAYSNGSMNVNQVQLFDLESEQFVKDHSIPLTPIIGAHGCVTTNNTHIFVVGGWNTTGSPNHLQILDIEANQWIVQDIEIDGIAHNWRNQLCNVVGNYLYVFGGRTGTNPGSDVLNGIYKYDTLLFN